MDKENINRREALKRIGKITLGIVGMSLLPNFEADAQYYYKYYN
jgi:hypothetical protein